MLRSPACRRYQLLNHAMVTTANLVIEFLCGLHAMDRLQTTHEQHSERAIDLGSATIYEVHPDFPNAECLSAELASGKTVPVFTSQLVAHLLVRHAEAMAVIEGGTPAAQYKRIAAHFAFRTGFGK